MTFTVAIIGRPNVGKSTLFNRLVGKRLAIVDDTPGVTRDRREGDARLGPLSFRVIDTAGLEDEANETLSGRMRQQTETAIADADAIIFMIDARTGLTPMDRFFADLIRKQGKPVICLANKCEGSSANAGYYESFELGLGSPIAFSAEHGEGLVELHDALYAVAGEDNGDAGADAGEDDEDKPLQLAIVGRPNVGKSTLVNRLVGEERQVTGPEAGITRDSIAIEWHYDGRPVRLFDTAGLRRKARVQNKLEKLSVADTLRAVQYAEVVILLIDGTQGIEKQDLTIADLVIQEGRGLVIAVNKLDAIADLDAARRNIEDALARSLSQVRGVPVVFLSAQTGRGIDRLMPAVLHSHKLWNSRIATSALNRWLADVLERNPPPSEGGRRVKVRYVSQVKSRPPTFVFFVNRPSALPRSYLRFLSNDIKIAFGLEGVPLRILTRKGENPYA